METIAAILKHKDRTVHQLPPSATVMQAVQAMCAAKIGSVLVVQEQRPVGIFTERDVMTRVILAHRDPAATPIAEVMTIDVVCVDEGTPTATAMALMTERRVRHLPVVDGDRVIGLVSIGDLVRQQASKQSYEIRMLTNYIMGSYPG